MDPADLWFKSTVKPDAKVSEYAAAPPQGMTNPPQNPKVRKMLLEELTNNGVKLTLDKWPPALPNERSCASRESSIMGAGAQWSRVSTSSTRLPTPNVRSRSCISTPDLRRLSTTASSGFGRSTGRLSSPPPAGQQLSALRARSPPKSDVQAALKEEKEEQWQPGPKLKQRTLTESEIRNSLMALRAQGRLHRAAVSDRYRFGADLSAGGSVVLQGAGADPHPQGCWASTASHLNVFHNKAMRTVNPSHLDLLPIEEKKRRKKKDEDDLELSKSGLFNCRYKVDDAYKTLRKLRREYGGDFGKPYGSIAYSEYVRDSDGPE